MAIGSITNERFGVAIDRGLIDSVLSLPEASGLGLTAIDVESAIRRAGNGLWTLEMFVNDRCSRNCPYCYVAKGVSESGCLSSKQGMSIVRNFSSFFKELSITGTEPLLPESRELLLSLLDEAMRSGYRSRVVITNGDYLAEAAKELAATGRITALAVSLDGPRSVHDTSRGPDSFGNIRSGFKAIDDVRRNGLLRFTNTTITNDNIDCLAETARESRRIGADFAAFHPAEHVQANPEAVRNLPNLLAEREHLTTALIELINRFRNGEIGQNVVLECTAGTADVMFEIFNMSDILNDFSLEKSPDGSGYTYLVCRRGSCRLAMDLRTYPFHGDIVLRINPDGRTSACRWLARSGWRGGNDVLSENLPSILFQPKTILVHSVAYQEYRQAKNRADLDGFIRRMALERKVLLNENR